MLAGPGPIVPAGDPALLGAILLGYLIRRGLVGYLILGGLVGYLNHGFQEHPIPRIARQIGVSYGTLRSWLNQDEINAGEREGLTTEEKEELSKLRRG